MTARKMDGSQPLKNKKKERFSRLVAAGETYVDAYCKASTPQLQKTAGRRVTGCRWAKLCEDRILHLKLEAGAARTGPEGDRTTLAVDVPVTPESPPETLTRAHLSNLMEETTQVLMTAADSALSAGAVAVSEKLRRTITLHAGRSIRSSANLPNETAARTEIDTDSILERLNPCVCNACREAVSNEL